MTLGFLPLPLNNFDSACQQGLSPRRIFHFGHLLPVDSPIGLGYIATTTSAQMAELVDALVSGTSVARRGGSSPLLGTNRLLISQDIKELATKTVPLSSRPVESGTVLFPQ